MPALSRFSYGITDLHTKSLYNRASRLDLRPARIVGETGNRSEERNGNEVSHGLRNF